MELIIKGDENKLRRLAKEIKLRVKRDGSEISLNKANKPPVKAEKKESPVKKSGGATGSKKDKK
jgi:hypothetical protein